MTAQTVAERVAACRVTKRAKGMCRACGRKAAMRNGKRAHHCEEHLELARYWLELCRRGVSARHRATLMDSHRKALGLPRGER